ncbi:MAG: hypothetical protein KC646_11640, partial [Candidatus Cloacimonetes bacterium]|nr:hypothetical protein [Candidatus Cloacimonadota bacterium]
GSALTISGNVLVNENLITGNICEKGAKCSTIILKSFYNDRTISLKNNNIYGNSSIYEIVNEKPIDFPDIDARNNYWGTTDTDALSELVYDFAEDGTKSLVIVSPILTESSPLTPKPTAAMSASSVDQIAISTGSNEVKVSFKAVDGVAFYKQFYSTVLSPVSSGSLNTLTNSVIISSLMNDIEYNLVIKAYNLVSEIQNDQAITFTPKSHLSTNPLMPTQLISQTIIFGGVKLEWQNIKDAVSYSIYTSITPNFYSATPITGLNTNSEDFLKPIGTWYVWIEAISQDGRKSLSPMEIVEIE